VSAPGFERVFCEDTPASQNRRASASGRDSQGLLSILLVLGAFRSPDAPLIKITEKN
jgi:hypothetical protein